MISARQPVNLAESIRARLKNLSKQGNEEFQLILSKFANERLLYRLGVSPFSGQFVLKGATLFRLWGESQHRATWDLDLLGRGSSNVLGIEEIVRSICGIPSEDGLVFDQDSIQGEMIRAAGQHAGVRIRLQAKLAGARIRMQVDIGFGDEVTPSPALERFPTLLDLPSPLVLVYPREAVVAEKSEAMISLGVTNSRMKDFYDIQALAASFEFQGAVLSEAIRVTFERRGTPFPPEIPLVLTRQFLGAPERQTQWRAFVRRGRLDAPPDAGDLADGLQRFLWPVFQAAAQNRLFKQTWHPGGPWQPEDSIPGS
ncbi:MAG: nucleotidyl transferase AbiEii/AbiGii toxin family protein [Acidobacteria bacterium]|nr:MAG: nucleotidyl transferase AbiEii/AbiGii toxin family protein [Acidobacteriota bacterium]